MRIIFFDLETYYNSKDDYSLKVLTPPEYILDPRFEAIGGAFMEGYNNDSALFWVDGPDLPKYFKELDTNIALCSHNFQFDGAIAAWRYGFLPEMSLCTLSIARATLGRVLGPLPSLAKVAEYLCFPPKLGTVKKVDGMNLDAIKAAGLFDEYVEYCKHDVKLCARIFKELVLIRKLFPANELAILDMVLRCTTEPRFVLDVDTLTQHLAEVRAKKEGLLNRLCLDKSDLMSNRKFADLLKMFGVEPPKKVSTTTGKETYAFSKTDVAFLALNNHPNPDVQALMAARLGVKSTLEETRTERFIKISRLTFKSNQTQPLMPMPLRYSAAGSHRLGGDWSLNVQNLSRPNPIKPGSGKIRQALQAPPGYKVMTVDASQIEARLAVYLSGQEDVVEQFRNNEDVYSILASEIYNRPINKKDNPNERFVGKQARLGLGYQLWWPKFKDRVKTDSINQLGYPIELTEDEAMHVVKTFRRLNNKIVNAWEELNSKGIYVLANGGEWEWGACKFSEGSIKGPSGLYMYYPNLSPIKNEQGNVMGWYYTTPHKGVANIYGGKLLENICQHLARVHTLGAALRIQKRSRQECGEYYRLVHQVHDENIFIVKDEHVDVMRLIMQEEMSRAYTWAEGCPFACEVGIGQNYGEAK